MTTSIISVSETESKIQVNGLDALTFNSAGNLGVKSINGGQLAGMRNLLINGNLAINQRGYVSGAAVGAANTYTLDRWRVVTSGQNLAFTASGNGSSMTAPAGGVEQVIEGANIGGGTYVLGWTGTATATVNGTARANGATFTLPANTNATVRLIGGTASLVQLEPGGTVTPFEHRPYGMELALCQRYLPVTYGKPGTSLSAVGQCVGTTTAYFVLPFSVAPRAVPTGITLGGAASTYSISNNVGGNVTLISLSYEAPTNSSAGVLSAVTAGSLVAGNATYLFNPSFIRWEGCEL